MVFSHLSKIILSLLTIIEISYGIGADIEIIPIHRSLSNINEVITFEQKVFGDLEKTDQYGLNLRRICVIHPYHPTGSSDAVQQEYFGVPTYLFMAQKPALKILRESPTLERYVENVGDNLSYLIQHIAKTTNINPHEMFNNLRIGICVQNAPWKNETLLLRPHYAVFDSQENIARTIVNQSKSIKSLILNSEGHTLEGQSSMFDLVDFNLSVHTASNSLQVISSPANMKIRGLQTNKTTYLWSFVADENNLYFTMHWLLTDQDFKEINKKEINSIEALMDELSNLSQATFPEHALEKKIHYPQLKYVFDYLISAYPSCEYTQLIESEQKNLLKYACNLANLGKHIPDSDCLSKALQYLKGDKEKPYLSYVLDYHLSRNVQSFTCLTKVQRDILLREAGILVADGKASRDTEALKQALNNMKH